MRILDGEGCVNGSCAKRVLTVELRSSVAVHGVTLCNSCVCKKIEKVDVQLWKERVNGIHNQHATMNVVINNEYASLSAP
jgi:hypothetical protein